MHCVQLLNRWFSCTFFLPFSIEQKSWIWWKAFRDMWRLTGHNEIISWTIWSPWLSKENLKLLPNQMLIAELFKSFVSQMTTTKRRKIRIRGNKEIVGAKDIQKRRNCIDISGIFFWNYSNSFPKCSQTLPKSTQSLPKCHKQNSKF